MSEHPNVTVYTREEVEAKIEAIYAEYPMLRGVRDHCCAEMEIAMDHGWAVADVYTELRDWLFLAGS